MKKKLFISFFKHYKYKLELPIFYKIVVNDTNYSFFIKVNFGMNMSLYKPILAAQKNEFPSVTRSATILESLSLDIMDKNGLFLNALTLYQKDSIKIKIINIYKLIILNLQSEIFGT